MITYLAIDPGKKGAMAFLNKLGEVYTVNLPENLTFDEMFKDTMDQYTVVIEDVPKFAGRMIPQSSVADLHFGFGYICGHFEARGFRVLRVKPQAWQKDLGLNTKGLTYPERKRKLKTEAVRRFPSLDVTLTNCDALLILDYARKNNL